MKREPVTSTMSLVRENSTTWHLTNAIFLRDSNLSIHPITMQRPSQNLRNQETDSKLIIVPWPTSWHPMTFWTDGIMDDIKGYWIELKKQRITYSQIAEIWQFRNKQKLPAPDTNAIIFLREIKLLHFLEACCLLAYGMRWAKLKHNEKKKGDQDDE